MPLQGANPTPSFGGFGFRERCPIAAQVCHSEPHPPLEDKGGGHMVACYRV